MRYLKITQTDGVRYILRVTRETPDFIIGIEVDPEGDEIVPRGIHPKIGEPYHQRERRVMRGAVKKAVEMRMNPTYATLEPVPQTHATIRKSAAQLNAEIAEALSAYGQHARDPKSKFRPIEGLQIPPASRSELNRFWRAHPALRKGCLRKYGFDPIDEEEAYWRYGLAEPDHLSLLRAVQQNNDIFSLALVKRWEVEELKHAREPTRNP